jgi:hypothetical protein
MLARPIALFLVSAGLFAQDANQPKMPVYKRNWPPITNLKLLPPDTRVHEEGSVMEDFRDALSVNCQYCHAGGGDWASDANPRKEIARQMIVMVREINAKFPGTGVFPKGHQEVTCFSCHRGNPHPETIAPHFIPDEQRKAAAAAAAQPK